VAGAGGEGLALVEAVDVKPGGSGMLAALDLGAGLVFRSRTQGGGGGGCAFMMGVQSAVCARMESWALDKIRIS
jgi:hypothetical protein